MKAEVAVLVPNSPKRLCGGKATLNLTRTVAVGARELVSKSRWTSRACPQGLCGRKATWNLQGAQLRSCVNVEVAVLGSPSLFSHHGLCGRKAKLKNRAQELCESRGGRPGLPVLNSPYALHAVDVK